ATRSVRGKASRVFSIKVVLPEPGELIRFTTSMLFSRKRLRNSAATRSFSLKTFFSSGTRFILLQLYVGELQFFSTNTLAAVGSTLRTVENKIRVCSQCFKAEAQCIGIDAGEFADA